MIFDYFEKMMPRIISRISRSEFLIPSAGTYHVELVTAPNISINGIVLGMRLSEGSLNSSQQILVPNHISTLSKRLVKRNYDRTSSNGSIQPLLTPTFFIVITPIFMKSVKKYLEKAYFTFSYPVTLPRLSTWTFNVTLKDISNIEWMSDTSISLRNGAIDVHMGISLSANAIVTSDFFALKKASLTLDLSELIISSSVGFELEKSSGNWKPLMQESNMTFKKLQVICCIKFNSF